MRSKLSVARVHLREIADTLRREGAYDHANKIYGIVDTLDRPAPIRRAPAKLKFPNSKIKEVRDYLAHFPDMSYHEIGLALNVNTGRISEIATGRR